VLSTTSERLPRRRQPSPAKIEIRGGADVEPVCLGMEMARRVAWFRFGSQAPVRPATCPDCGALGRDLRRQRAIVSAVIVGRHERPAAAPMVSPGKRQLQQKTSRRRHPVAVPAISMKLRLPSPEHWSTPTSPSPGRSVASTKVARENDDRARDTRGLRWSHGRPSSHSIRQNNFESILITVMRPSLAHAAKFNRHTHTLHTFIAMIMCPMSCLLGISRSTQQHFPF